jgi:hypothetical protein
MATQLMQAIYLGGQLDMILFVELLFGVPLEISILRHWEIWGIKKNKISGLRVFL